MLLYAVVVSLTATIRMSRTTGTPSVMLRVVITTLTTLLCWATILVAGAGGTIHAVSTSRSLPVEPRPTSRLEQALLDDAADGRLDRVRLIAAALIASGETNTQTIARHQTDVDRLARRVRPTITRHKTPNAQAEALLVALHREVFTRHYLADQSDIAASLEHGDYNCLSSVILYVALGRTFGLDIRPAVLPGHIVAVLRTENGPRHVETTCAEWFAAVRDGRAASIRVPVAGGSQGYDRRKAKPLSDAELIALVYYNQGYEHLTRNRFVEAYDANQKALALDPDSVPSRGNFLATINNWSLALCRQGKFREASRIVSHGLRVAPGYAPLVASNRHVYRLWVERLVAQGKQRDAIELLRSAAQQWPAELYFAQYLARISRNHL